MTEAVLADAARWPKPDSLLPAGERPWDGWYKRAIATRVPEELAALGRALMREAHVSRWHEDACIASGWLDEGQAMIALALDEPARAERSWSRLLETQGAIEPARTRRV
jgi:hypothetical protein